MGVSYALDAHKDGPREKKSRVHLEERHDNVGAHESFGEGQKGLTLSPTASSAEDLPKKLCTICKR